MDPSRTRASLALLGLLLVAPLARAHSGGLGAGPPPTFSLPVWVVWALGALVVAVSFVLVGIFLTRDDLTRIDTNERRGGASRVAPRWSAIVVAALLLAILVPAALATTAGPLPAVVLWVGLWSVLPMLSYLAGDLWRFVDPFALARERTPPLRYPAWLAAWPSVVLLLALTGLEVLPAWTPRSIALMLLAYAAFTLAGMRLFGARAWRENAEVFSRMLRAWASIAPGTLARRGLGGALPARGLSDVAFVVALLYGVNFDGFRETRLGALALQALAPLGTIGAHLVVLLAGYLAFLAAYLLAAHAIARFSHSLEGTTRLAGRFALSLVPIAAGYHFAHHVFYALDVAPVALAALADPWGLGWAGGAALAAWSPPAFSATTIGWIQILVIVLAHVLAVILAHRLAFSGFTSRVQAVRSEVPLTLVMVFYTFVGLAIVSSGHHVVGV